MAEKMTSISLPGLRRGAGLAEYGTVPVADLIARYRRHAQLLFEEAEAVLNAADEDFHIETYNGVYVMRNRKTIQQGKID